MLQGEQTRVSHLEDYLLALLCTKRASMFPLTSRQDHDTWEEMTGPSRVRKKALDRLLAPMYPMQPLVGLYHETRVSLDDYYPRNSPTLVQLADIPGRTERLGGSPDGVYVWVGFRRRKPSGLRQLRAPLRPGIASVPYEMHTRIIYQDGRELYDKDLFAVTGNFMAPYLLPLPSGYKVTIEHLLDTGVQNFKELLAHIFFRQHMQQFWHVRWAYASKEILFPATEKAVKSLAKLREGPRSTPSGRRNPLLHWVTEHLREGSSGHLIPVTEHLRGTERFIIDDYAAEIINPAKAGRA